MGIRIVAMTNSHPDFYRLIGPFLAKRSIAKEIGGTLLDGVIWDDDEKQWFVALQDGAVAGFATMLPPNTAQTILFCEAYVLPEYRDHGLYTRLLDERLAHCPAECSIRILVHPPLLSFYEAKGFVRKRDRGKFFVEMVREARHE